MESRVERFPAIAVIGIAGRFPGARDLADFWDQLAGGAEMILHMTREELIAAGADPAVVDAPSYVPACGFVEGADAFDANFFGFSPREAEITDPQHRLFLECAWEAVEDAGYDPARFDGRIGVYAGAGPSRYFAQLLANPALVASVGIYQLTLANDKDHLSTRAAYKLNLTGPAVTVQTACSTSLVAVHVACQSLLSRECDMALAGGVSVHSPEPEGYVYDEGGILSPDGHCRAFDAAAKGTVLGNGAGVVMLKRLEDAIREGDHIRAVIRGSAINNDGAGKIGYTAPSVDGQAAVIAEALGVAGVSAGTISYVEAHGTGTVLGDPIEIAGLCQAFRESTDAVQYCAIGSVKTNIGHLDAAAGVASLIKTTLALEHRQIPPSLHFEQPNTQIEFSASPFYVNTRLVDWQAGPGPLRAGVSSFGMGGTNAHVVLEEAPAVGASGESKPHQVLLLSAKTADALEAATERMARFLEQNQGLNFADVCFTLQVGRRPFQHRRAVVCGAATEAAAALAQKDFRKVLTSQYGESERPVVFMFPGQGSQYPNMAVDLYAHEGAFRSVVDECAQLLAPTLGLDLREILFPAANKVARADELLRHTSVTQPALFVIEYALARMYMAWGVSPQAMIGHSLGEYVAACLAGVMSLTDVLKLVAERGRLIAELPEGAMLVVPLPEDDLRLLLSTDLSLAAVNAPASCVVAGPTVAIERLEQVLTQRSIQCRRLRTSHAFHSEMMEAIVAPFTEVVSRVRLSPPRIPFISGVTGSWITAEQATDPLYWARHLRETVRFNDGLRKLLTDGNPVLLEAGPGQTLSSLARQSARGGPDRLILPSLRRPEETRPDTEVLASALAKLWLAGVAIDWTEYHRGETRRRVPLPTYPFQRQRYWIGSKSHVSTGSTHLHGGAELTSLHSSLPAVHERSAGNVPYVAPRSDVERALAALWSELLGIEHVGIDDDFLELGGHSLLGTQLIARIRQLFGVDVSIRALFNHPTVAELAEIVSRSKAGALNNERAMITATRTEEADLLSRLDELSEAEIEELLERELAKRGGADR